MIRTSHVKNMKIGKPFRWGHHVRMKRNGRWRNDSKAAGATCLTHQVVNQFSWGNNTNIIFKQDSQQERLIYRGTENGDQNNTKW